MVSRPDDPPEATHPPAPPDAAFYFDLASPEAYLVAERILRVLPCAAEWQPVLARELPGTPGGGTDAAPEDEAAFRERIERRAHEEGLQPLRRPADFPFDSERAMLVATYAKSIGRTVPFAQAAFRQAFAGGHSLARMDNVLIAAAACEMHPKAVLKSAELSRTREQLRASTAAAARAGVTDVPAIRIGARVFHGEGAPEAAAAYAGELMGVAR
ncbi:MAG TPA: DsbA family protein [Solirubrobacteraceae bacterium]|jgi:2-hydroxychromene-2-carboxylate isomerase|nr:DsbA family protein [Solirubrobacteraceae bacterium]